jgi:hypothetical protein
MTAIAGFLCADGVVIAADTEENYGDAGDKAYSHKLFPIERPQANLCVAGAGTGYLIDYAKEQIISIAESGVKNNAEFKLKLAAELNRLYNEEFKHYPVDSPRHLAIQLLVGIQLRKEADASTWAEPMLFECESNLVTNVIMGRSRILGAGELLKEVAIQFAGWGLTPALAEWASIYIIHEAKRRYGGIGGKTHTCTLWSDGKKMSHTLGKNILEKEAILDGMTRTSQLLMLSLDPSVSDSKAGDFVDAGKTWLKVARRELQNLQKGRGSKAGSITINCREMRSFFRKLQATSKPSASRKSEPEQ